MDNDFELRLQYYKISDPRTGLTPGTALRAVDTGIQTLGCSFEICVNIGLEPIIINSVFATFRLSLLAISHFRRFSRSEFIAILTSLIDSPVAVKFVSSANSWGLVLFKQLGNHGYKLKRVMVLKLNLGAHRNLLYVQTMWIHLFCTFGCDLQDMIVKVTRQGP